MKDFKRIFMAAIPVVVGIVIANNVRSLAGNTVVGKVVDGSLVRRIG